MRIADYLAASKSQALPFLDVRAPLEFQKGHIPGSWNAPILNDEERHQVGLTYKTKGQQAAIALGQRLVDPHRDERVQIWIDGLKKSALPLLACWRGGLRSETAQAWIQEAGLKAERLEGGYKALRNSLLEILARPYSGYVLTGLTGSGKTEFIAAHSSVDLEALAHHRGSAFGGFPSPQPSQQSFENALALKLHQSSGPLLLEDESRLIGRCLIPDEFLKTMQALPRVELVTPLEERIRLIEKEYVKAGEVTLLRQLGTIRNRLGGLAHEQLCGKIRSAFRTGDHSDWIRDLLTNYYDPMYTHSQQRHAIKPVFTGDKHECRRFFQERGLIRTM